MTALWSLVYHDLSLNMGVWKQNIRAIRLAELVTKESVSRFDFAALCDMHYYIFQDIYEWAGQVRIINIEKAEQGIVFSSLGG